MTREHTQTGDRGKWGSRMSATGVAVLAVAGILVLAAVLVDASAEKDGSDLVGLDSARASVDSAPGSVRHRYGPARFGRVEPCRPMVHDVVADSMAEPGAVVLVDPCPDVEEDLGPGRAEQLRAAAGGPFAAEIKRDGNVTRRPEASMQTAIGEMPVRIWSRSSDGRYLASAFTSVLASTDGRDWSVIADSGSLPASGDLERRAQVGSVNNVVEAADGSGIYATVGNNGVAFFGREGTARWLVDPRIGVSDRHSLSDGEIVPANPDLQIIEMAAAPDGGVYTLTAEQVRRLGPDGTSHTLLDVTTATKTPAVSLVPKQVEVEGNVTACCGGSRFGGFALSQAGHLYVFDTEGHQLLRIGADGWVSLVAKGTGFLDDIASGCEQCLQPEYEFGADLERTVPVHEYSFLATNSSGQVGMDVDADGSLVMAMGQNGLIEIADIDKVVTS